ncbi:NAD-dependent epimerase/dehydratase family protein [Bdellovibrionota bacterium FG-2]
MKILITGGSGFIGTHLCRALMKQGPAHHQGSYGVRVLDLAPPKTPIDNVEYILGDVRSSRDVKQALEGVDAVFHLAALVSVPYCQEHPVEGYETNLMGTLKVLEAAHQEGLRQQRPLRIIFASSAAVYGNQGKKDVSLCEEDALDQPLSFYGAQKLGSEQAIRLFAKDFGIPAIVFRFFNVYGPGQDPSSPYSGVISVFRDAIERGEALRLNGGGEYPGAHLGTLPGSQTRDFVSVHDIVRACVQALAVPAEKCDGRAINLGTGNAVSIRELAEALGQAFKKDVKLVPAPARSGDIEHSRADNRRAREVLGWEARVELASGLGALR